MYSLIFHLSTFNKQLIRPTLSSTLVFHFRCVHFLSCILYNTNIHIHVMLPYFFTFLIFGLRLNAPRYLYAYTPPTNISHSWIFLFSHSKNNNVDMNDYWSTIWIVQPFRRTKILWLFRPTTMHCIDNNDSNNYMNIAMMK